MNTKLIKAAVALGGAVLAGLALKRLASGEPIFGASVIGPTLPGSLALDAFNRPIYTPAGQPTFVDPSLDSLSAAQLQTRSIAIAKDAGGVPLRDQQNRPVYTFTKPPVVEPTPITPVAPVTAPTTTTTTGLLVPNPAAGQKIKADVKVKNVGSLAGSWAVWLEALRHGGGKGFVFWNAVTTGLMTANYSVANANRVSVSLNAGQEATLTFYSPASVMAQQIDATCPGDMVLYIAAHIEQNGIEIEAYSSPDVILLPAGSAARLQILGITAA